jgi:putative membrane protein
MEAYYLYIKAFHIIAVIAWMAGLLYLPRLYVYHSDVKVGSKEDKMLQLMEVRLLRFIMNPAMIVSLVLGIMLIVITKAGAPGQGGWMHVKLLCLVGLFGFHGFLAVCRKKFVNGANSRSNKFYRLINEIPTILMIIIVILAVVKPF